jgi:phosphatidylglycerophosphate synthase
MTKVTFESVRQRCVDGRFFPYDSWHDRIFVPPAMILTWMFIRLRVSGNAVSWISGFFVIAGACGMTLSDPYMVVLGSFGYLVFYLLDYVDGAVSRYNGTAGLSGQYLDWIIHIIASVATMTGLVIGANINAGFWIVPFSILAVIASALATGRFSMGWFAICMERQQRLVKGRNLFLDNLILDRPSHISRLYWLTRSSVYLLFHENYIIFSLPILSVLQFFYPNYFPDFRVMLIMVAGTFYFSVMVLEIQRIIITRKLEETYNKLFDNNSQIELPKDHFFE